MCVFTHGGTQINWSLDAKTGIVYNNVTKGKMNNQGNNVEPMVV